MIQCNVKLTGEGDQIYVEIPAEIMSQLDKTKKRIKIKAAFNGIPYRGLITPYGGVPVLGILKSIQKQLNKRAGDTITLTLEKDTEERKAEIPPDLKKLFQQHKKAAVFFETLSYTNQKEFCVWITSAKKTETRISRLNATIEKLQAGKKNPSSK